MGKLRDQIREALAAPRPPKAQRPFRATPAAATCPHCRARIAEAGDGETQPPEDGDYVVCAECCQIARYYALAKELGLQRPLRLRKLVEPERENLPQYIADNLRKARAGLAALNSMRRAQEP